VKVLHAQRLFTQLRPLLEKCSRQAAALLALAPLLPLVPAAVLRSQLESLLPSLLRALSATSDAAGLRSVLETFQALLTDSPDALAADLSALVPALLVLAKKAGVEFVSVRVTALECLRLLSQLQYSVLYPYRQQVLLGSQACMDDPKRVVRQQAVQTRNVWFTLQDSKAVIKTH